MKTFIFIFVSAICSLAYAAAPAGLWKTIDDSTGKPKSIVKITDNGGTLTGSIQKLLTNRPDAVCEECQGDLKNKPIAGMTILSGLRNTSGDTWEGGTVLDPKNGKTYKARIKVIEGGKKLELRGYLGPFYRTQVWEKAD